MSLIPPGTGKAKALAQHQAKAGRQVPPGVVRAGLISHITDSMVRVYGIMGPRREGILESLVGLKMVATVTHEEVPALTELGAETAMVVCTGVPSKLKQGKGAPVQTMDYEFEIFAKRPNGRVERVFVKTRHRYRGLEAAAEKVERGRYGRISLKANGDEWRSSETLLASELQSALGSLARKVDQRGVVNISDRSSGLPTLHPAIQYAKLAGQGFVDEAHDKQFTEALNQLEAFDRPGAEKKFLDSLDRGAMDYLPNRRWPINEYHWLLDASEGELGDRQRIAMWYPAVATLLADDEGLSAMAAAQGIDQWLADNFWILPAYTHKIANIPVTESPRPELVRILLSGSGATSSGAGLPDSTQDAQVALDLIDLGAKTARKLLIESTHLQTTRIDELFPLRMLFEAAGELRGKWGDLRKQIAESGLSEEQYFELGRKVLQQICDRQPLCDRLREPGDTRSEPFLQSFEVTHGAFMHVLRRLHTGSISVGTAAEEAADHIAERARNQNAVGKPSSRRTAVVDSEPDIVRAYPSSWSNQPK